jgi:hypothetical protein
MTGKSTWIRGWFSFTIPYKQITIPTRVIINKNHGYLETFPKQSLGLSSDHPISVPEV